MINRFFVEETMPDREFECEIGDVLFVNGHIQIVTGWGIYNNQMWAEKIYEDGCRIAGGGYITALAENKISNTEMIKHAINSYKKEITDVYERFMTSYFSRDLLEKHLSQFLAGTNAN